MKVIKAMTIMHEIKEINILYTQSVLADCWLAAKAASLY